MTEFVKYRVGEYVIDGSDVADGTCVTITLFGHVKYGPAAPGRFFMLEDWSGPKEADWKHEEPPADAQDDRDLVDWLVTAATNAILDALAVMPPPVGVPFTESATYKELKRAITAARDR